MIQSKREVNGVLLLNKCTGMTSNAALQTVKRLFNAKKAGHTGSLDPLASGVLPICFGKATKLSHHLLEANKSYLVTAKLGVVTDSGDSEGNILAENDVPLFSKEKILEVIEGFKGAGQQIPTMFSALKHRGQPLYKYARKGITIERPPRDIFIFEYELISQSKDELQCHIKCSKGTYIRTLIEDLGKVLGCGAHVIQLERTKAGPFDIEQTYSLEDLEEISDSDSKLLPQDCLIEKQQ